MDNSVSSPINPRQIIANLEQTAFRDLVDENSARLAQNNPEDFTGIVSSCAIGTNKSRAFVGGSRSNPSNNSSVSRMSSGGGVDPVRSALAPRTSEAINGVRLEKKFSTIKPVLVSTTSSGIPPLSEASRWRGGLTPPRRSTTQPTLRPFDPDRPRIPKHARDTNSSPLARHSTSSLASPKSARSASAPPTPPDWQWDPDSQEQALFEQRLCEDAYGVAVRKINQNGKAQLRYIKCIPLTSYEDDNTSSSKSVSSLVRSLSLRSRDKRKAENDENSDTDKLLTDNRKVLVWGKKKEHMMHVDQFISVQIGKTTDRTRRNPQPASRLLSLLAKDRSLDIEAPTRLDRDKFARAFARFLRVPLVDPATEEVVRPVPPPSLSVPDLDVIGINQSSLKKNPTLVKSQNDFPQHVNDDDYDVIPLSRNVSDDEGAFDVVRSQNASSAGTSHVLQGKEFIASGPVVSGFSPDQFKVKDDKSDVSSLTGGNYDQDIVEELHNALEGLKTELAESRAEASRAVKVAEQAIQSAENNNSKDWNSTVTHKAAEAAALAQKKSAEAMAKQRLAEERLAAERKNAIFWRKQAEAAEEEAGVLQTRAAAAEVQRASMSEELQCERERTAQLIEALKTRFDSADIHHREALEAALERNRALEIELSSIRRDLQLKSNSLSSGDNFVDSLHNNSKRKKLTLLGKPRKRSHDAGDTTSLLSNDSKSSDAFSAVQPLESQDSLPVEDVLKLHAEFSAIRLQFELLKRTTSEELNTLPETTSMFANQTSAALVRSQAEVSRLQQRLALESSTRRKLLNEVQDLRGTVRVVCRPRPFQQPGTTSLSGAFSVPSNEILVLHRERMSLSTDTTPLSFEFDHVFAPDADQKDVYAEIDELNLCALDGFNVCLMAYGQSGSGKTFTMFGDVLYRDNGSVEISHYGVHLLGLKQLFNVSKHRRDRFEDRFTLSIVEVNGEKLVDLVVGTAFGGARSVENVATSERKSSKSSRRSDDEAYSQVSSRSRKLDIRIGRDGETFVQGVANVDVSSVDDVVRLWEEVLTLRANRLKELGTDIESHEMASHVIATLRVLSTNIATGISTQGKIQFVKFAGADLIRTPSKPKTSKSNNDVLAPVGNNFEWKYANKSLSAFLEVAAARARYDRDVPYRNSTITHLLQDALEGDTKVMMMLCVSSDPKDLQQTASALRVATMMRRVVVGKATKHVIPRASPLSPANS